MRTFVPSALLALIASACATVNDSIVGTMSSERMCYLLGSSEPVIPGSRDAMQRELARRGYTCVTDAAQPASNVETRSIQLLRSAVAALRVGAWDEAEEQANRALALDEMNTKQAAAAYVIRSYARARLGRLREARADLARATLLRPDLASVPTVREYRNSIAPPTVQPTPRGPGIRPSNPQQTPDVPPPVIDF